MPMAPAPQHSAETVQAARTTETIATFHTGKARQGVRRMAKVAGSCIAALGLLVVQPALTLNNGLPGVAGGLLAVSVAHAQELVLDHGHIDLFHVSVGASGLVMELTEDVTGTHVAHQPEGVLVEIGDKAWSENIPVGEGSGYILPLAQDPELPWPGWDTNGVKTAIGQAAIDIVFDQVTGPGNVYLYTIAGLSTEPAPLLASGNLQLTSGDFIRQDPPGHTHAFWVFTQPGDYQFTVHAEAPGNEAEPSAKHTYAFRVSGVYGGTGAAATKTGDSYGNYSDTVSNAPLERTTRSNPVPLQQAAPVAGNRPAAEVAAPAPASRAASAASASAPAAAAPAQPVRKSSLAGTGLDPLTLAVIFCALGLCALGASLVGRWLALNGGARH